MTEDWTDGWTPVQESTAYTARAQAIVEALMDYEQSHPTGAPCLYDALQVALGELEP